MRAESAGRTPFDWLTRRARLRALAALTLLLVLSSSCLLWLDSHLVTDAVPNGIIGFELAGSGERSAEILASWSQQAREFAMLIQGFDALYLFVYPAWFALAVTCLCGALPARWSAAGRVVAWGVLLAAPLDFVENCAMVHQLIHGAGDGMARLAWWCAVPKFALVSVAEIFLVAGGLAWLLGFRAGR